MLKGHQDKELVLNLLEMLNIRGFESKLLSHPSLSLYCRRRVGRHDKSLLLQYGVIVNTVIIFLRVS